MSRRNVAYYESQAGRLPAALLPEFARALKTSLNQILGEEPVRDIPKNTRLWKRFLQMEDLSKADQRAVLQYIEMMLDRSVRRRSHG